MLYVETIYACGSFTAAAKKLFVTTPALSIAIKKEEKNLGALLFNRDVHPIQLTTAGKIYLETIKKVSLAEHDLRTAVQDLNNLHSGLLRLGGTQYVNSFILSPTIAKFKKLYPCIKLEIKEAASDEVGFLLKNGDIDLMFSANPLNWKAFKRTPAFKDTILFALPKELCKKKNLLPYKLTYEDICKLDLSQRNIPSLPTKFLKDLPLILLNPGNNLHTRSLHFCKSGGFDPNPVLMVDQLVTAYHLACGGTAGAFVSDILVKNSKKADLFYFKMPGKEAVRSFYAITSNQHYVPLAAHKFLELF